MRNNICFSLSMALLLLVPALASAADRPTLFAKTKYFSIMGPPDMDVFQVLHRINYNYFLHVDNLLASKTDDPKDILGSTADAVLMETARILGINVYSFNAVIEFLPDGNTLKITIKNVTGTDIREQAFYFHEDKTIYISIDGLTAGVLGHEMAHALISHYFGAPPAENIQEILAGYVDFSLSKQIKR